MRKLRRSKCSLAKEKLAEEKKMVEEVDWNRCSSSMSSSSANTEMESSSESTFDVSEAPEDWIEFQTRMKNRVTMEDEFSEVKYVGGLDVSYSWTSTSLACGALVVLDINTLNVVYQNYSLVNLDIPYVPGFLAFREAPVLLELLEKMKRDNNPYYPHLLMVDGNGLLHPRGFGLACHIGVLSNLPAIGIGKNLHHVDGLTQVQARQLLEAKGNHGEDFVHLVGNSGSTYGVAMRFAQHSVKPIYISIGHRISLATAIRIVKTTCKYRVPEPIRQADIKSREYLRNLALC